MCRVSFQCNQITVLLLPLRVTGRDFFLSSTFVCLCVCVLFIYAQCHHMYALRRSTRWRKGSRKKVATHHRCPRCCNPSLHPATSWRGYQINLICIFSLLNVKNFDTHPSASPWNQPVVQPLSSGASPVHCDAGNERTNERTKKRFSLVYPVCLEGFFSGRGPLPLSLSLPFCALLYSIQSGWRFIFLYFLVVQSFVAFTFALSGDVSGGLLAGRGGPQKRR